MIPKKSKLPDEELFQYLHSNAEKYSRLTDYSFLFISKSAKKDEYYWHEVVFPPRNFMHLTGIKSPTNTAMEFYDKCLNCHEDLTIKDCTPAYNHTRKDIAEKNTVLCELLNLKNVKYFSVGEKDKINQYVDFTFAYGQDAIIGFRRDKDMRYRESFPVTCAPQNIRNYCTKVYKISFLLRKTHDQEKYSELIVSCKKGLLFELMETESFPSELRQLIQLESKEI